MQCRQCQNEIATWHFYCPNCRAILQDFQPVEKPRQSRFHRLTREWTSWAAIGLFTIGSVVMAVVIEWKELFNLLHASPDTGSVAEVRHGERAHGNGTRGARNAGNGQNTGSNEGVHPEPTPAESVRDLARRVDELPTNEERMQGLPEQASGESPPALPEPILGAGSSSAVEIERTEPPANGKTGIVSINSYIPARVYIDGQYSGITPRTVHLLVGEHNLRLVADGYQEWTSRIRVKNRQQLGVIAALTKTPLDR